MAKKIPLKKNNPESRINDVLKVISGYARLDFSKKARLSKRHDLHDALAAGINMLGEELKESTISLREKEALVKEVHHRVKNNLQIISSLLTLQANFVMDERTKDQFLESRERVRSMALIHEMLYRSKQISEINFSDYLKTLVNSLFSVYYVKGKNIDLKMNIKITEKLVDIDTAIPCGLIVNEIISNSFKYAFAGKKKGSISITLKNPGAKIYILTIKDDGIGFSEKLKTASFGLQLINTLAEQLNSAIKLETGNCGTKYEIEFSSRKKENSSLNC